MNDKLREFLFGVGISSENFIKKLNSAGFTIVPIELTEDMAAAMECEFNTEGQWAAALREASRT